jgi:hypothetical protein
MAANAEIPETMIALLRQKEVPPAVKGFARHITTQPWVRPWHHDDQLTSVDCCGNGQYCWHWAKKTDTTLTCKGCSAPHILHKNWLCPHLSTRALFEHRCYFMG